MDTVAPKQANWFTYFPEDYRWSSAICNIVGGSVMGGSDIGEVDRAGRRLRKRLGDDAAWFEEWVRLGDEVREVAGKAEKAGHGLSAAAAYLRACCYYQMGERFRTPKDEAALTAYRTSVDCFHEFAALVDRPRIEIVEVPYEGKSLPGYWVRAENTDAKRPPAMVFFDGLDITKELQYLRGVPELVRRGISCLVMDGPGTGEAIRFRGMPVRYDYEAAGSACLDYLETRSDVDAKRVGIMAISLGGYYAPRCASMEPRFKACIAWGAIWDYYETWKKRIDAKFKTSLSVPGHHISWILGVETLGEALKKLEDFRLDGVVQQMRCPFLVTHGAEDEQVPLADAEALYKASGSPDKTLRVFTAEEGGAQHCQRDYPSIATSTMFDWLKEKL
jgi:dipeptidyl aminopeptidase/acylaminoacyl peptidase